MQAMKEKFVLNEGVFLVRGAKRGAIYDLGSGNIYSLNETARNIIEGKIEDEQFWQKLLGMGLAVDTGKQKVPIIDGAIPEVCLDFMWLELINDCNLKCLHCYASSESLSESQDLGMAIWRRIIREGVDLGCRKLQFIGGEPLKYRSVFNLAAFAREAGYNFIEIFTNATLLTLDKVKIIKNLGLYVAVSLYSSEPSIHDQITQTPGSFKRTCRGLRLLKEFSIPTRVAIVVMRQNEDTIVETRRFIQDLSLKDEKLDIVRPTGRGCILDLLPTERTVTTWGLMTKPNFQTSKESFFRYHHWNSCWAGKIAITSAGDILPCIFARDHIVGNVLQNNLKEIVFGKNLQRLWRLTKDNVEVCRDCEYHYACKDCRPLAEAQSGKLTSKYPRCTYDPYTGAWEDKI